GLGSAAGTSRRQVGSPSDLQRTRYLRAAGARSRRGSGRLRGHHRRREPRPLNLMSYPQAWMIEFGLLSFSKERIVWRTVEHQLYSVMRIVFGFLFVMHGLQRLLGVFGGTQVGFASLVGTAALIEAVGRALVVG